MGSHLVELLLHDQQYAELICFVRRPSGRQHQKLIEHIVSFDEPESWRHLVKGDVLFSALGTTLKTAGSKEAQYKVDHTYQYQFAQAAAASNVPRYVLVSAANASLRSPFFYSRMKAELERDVQQLPFQHTSILRPGLLAGERKEKRTGERLALRLSKLLQKVPGFGALRSIAAADVARAMVYISLHQTERFHIYPMQELFSYAALYGQADKKESE